MSFLFSSVTPQCLSVSFILANEGREEEAKETLTRSFDYANHDTVYLSNQFVNWSTGKTDQMDIEDAFNEAAFYVVHNKRNAAISALKKKLTQYDLEANDFSESFIDWGLSLIKLNEILNNNP